MRDCHPRVDAQLKHDCFDTLDAVFTGEATDEQFAGFEQLLRDNEAVRTTAVHYLHLHALIERAIAETSPATDGAKSAGTAQASPAHSAVHTIIAGAVSAVSRPIVWSVLAAGVLFAGYVAVISWNMLARDRLTAENDSGGVVATIRDVADAQWSPNSRLPDRSMSLGAPITAGQLLSIQSGLIELELNSGTTLLIEGPADWQITSNNNATFKHGKLVAKVPKQAIGFTLDTPTARIVDLGTEFGVEVGTDGATGVQVLQGTVTLGPKAEGRGKKPLGQRLSAGQAVRIDAGSQSIIATDFAPQKFARRVARATTKSSFSSQTLLVDLKDAATATQSSNLKADSFPASAAIDGDPNTFSHTGVEDSAAWWQLDLGRSRAVAVVVLRNRESCCGGWLRDITVKILDDDGQTVLFKSPLLNPKNRLGAGERNFDVGPPQIVCDLLQIHGQAARGRYVRVERAPCQVTDKDIRNDNVAEAKVASGNVIALGDLQIFEAADVAVPEVKRTP